MKREAALVIVLVIVLAIVLVIVASAPSAKCLSNPLDPFPRQQIRNYRMLLTRWLTSLVVTDLRLKTSYEKNNVTIPNSNFYLMVAKIMTTTNGSYPP